MRFEDVETIRRSDFRHSDFRLSDGIEGDSFSVMSHGQHGSGRFLDFARNDGRRLETIRRETSDGQISDGQTSDGPFGPFVGGLYNHRGPSLLVKSRLWRERKTCRPGCACRKCTPIPAARYFHPEGEVCSPLSICPHKQRKA